MVEKLMRFSPAPKPVYVVGTNILSSLGLTNDAHWNAVAQGKTGVKKYEDESLSNVPFFASKIAPDQWQLIHDHTRTDYAISPFEQMALYSCKKAIAELETSINLGETVLILSTTKGNIEWLGLEDEKRLLLTTSAAIIAKQLGIMNKPVVISHACVSGVIASLYAQRLLQAGRYKTAIVIGADRFTRFVLSGFQSFQAIANEPCKPFDEARKGINLGEAAATMIFSTENNNAPLAKLLSGSTSNDANHISGPSRTGEELSIAIDRSLKEAKLLASDMDMISAHGTATLYNDEMESKAFALSNLSEIPLHSLKGYIGHTLGAAGVSETVMIIESMKRQQLIPSAGFSSLGVSEQLNVTKELTAAPIDYVLKTASGFGGCNAVSLWGKVV